MGATSKRGKGRGVSISGRCTLEQVVSLNNGMTDYQKQAMIGLVLAPILKYYTFEMERNLALALVKTWVPRSKAFRLGDRLLPSSVFDVALMAGLPTVGQQVDFHEDTLMTEFGNIIGH